MKKIVGIVLAILLSIFVVRVYFHPGVPYTHDGENHLARFANYVLAVRERQIPPRFAPNLFDHFGYPVFNYNYPLANILSVPFSYLHFHYETTFKILMFLAVLIGFLGVERWLAALSFSKQGHFFATVLFASCPYLLNAIIFRGNIGEVYALCLLPWAFWGVEKIRQNIRQNEGFTLVFFLIITSALALSHNILAVFSIPIVFFYAVIRLRTNVAGWLKLLGIFIGTILLTLWFWLPALAEKSEIVLDSAGITQQFLDHFPTFSQLLFAPLQFGFSYKGPVDNLSFSLGVVQCVVLLFAVLLLVHSFLRKSRARLWIAAIVIIEVVFFLLQLGMSKPVWLIAEPIARYIQFPWRLAAFWEILLLPVAAYVFDHIGTKGKVLLSVGLALQLFGFSHIAPADYFHRDLRDYDYFTQSTSTNNENRTKTFTYQSTLPWQPSPQIASGSGQITVQSWQGSQRSYHLVLQHATTVIEPTMKFLGWETKANGRAVTYIDSPEIGGRIAYHLEPGSYDIYSQFTQNTWARQVGNIVSIISIFSIIVYTGIVEWKNGKKIKFSE